METELIVWKAEVEQRLRHLDEWRDLLDQHETELASSEARDTAAFLALRSLVRDVAIHAGVEPEKVESCFQERFLHFLDHLNLKAEESNPGTAAMLDDRQPDEIPTERSFRPLFDSPTE